MRYATKVWHYIRFTTEGWDLAEVECEAVIEFNDADDWEVVGFWFEAARKKKDILGTWEKKPTFFDVKTDHLLIRAAVDETKTTAFEEKVFEAINDHATVSTPDGFFHRDEIKKPVLSGEVA